MKTTISILSIIIFLTFGCAKAGQPVNAPEQPVVETKASPADIEANIRAKIAEYDKRIAEVSKKLESLPEWQQFLKDIEVYNASLKLYREQAKKASEINEVKIIKYFQREQIKLNQLLEGGK